MFKNTAAKFMVFAFDTTTNTAKTGDAANITCYVSKDYGTVTVLADTSATEMDSTNAKGYYLFDAAQGETNGDCLMVSAKSSTANIAVIGAPAVIYTRPTTNWLAPATLNRTLVVDAAGLADANCVKLGPTGSGTAQTAKDVGGAVPSAAAGASGGLLISGSNSGTTTLGALTVTGSITISDGLLISRSSSNSSAITATGNGTGSGAVFTSGSGATGDGIQATAASTNGNGFAHVGTGTGAGFKSTGGGTGNGLQIIGGGTSGDAILTSATSGHGATFAGTGTTKHGINATGGATSSDGIRATGGGTGNGINAQSGSGATGDGILAKSNATAGNGMTLTHNGSGVNDFNATTTPLTLAKTTNITGFNDIAAPTGFATATFPSGTIANTTNITAGTITTVTNLTNAPTAGDLTSTMKTSVENAVWNATMSSHLTAGTTGASLNGAGSAGDPWGTSLPGSYTSGQAGYIVGNNLDATVSSRLATSGYTVPDNTSVTAIKAKTDKMAFTAANQIDSNIIAVNSHNVTGDGHSGTEWGPA